MRWIYVVSSWAFAAFSLEDAAGQSLYPDLETQESADDAVQEGETVDAAIRAALSFAPALNIARAEQKNAGAERFRALGGFLPNLEASASYTNNNWRSSSLTTLEDRDGATLAISASQPVFQGLAAMNRYRAARARYNEAEFGFLSAAQQTALEAAQTHAGVILARAIVSHRIDNLMLVGKQFEAAQRRMEAGAQSRTGVEQARMRQAQAQVDLGDARDILAAREAAYQRITGRMPPPEMIADTSERNYGVDSLQAALDEALANNPALNAARAGAKAAQHEKIATRGDFAPQLSIEANYLRRYDDPAPENSEEEYQVVARMRLPLFDQGGNIADLRASAAAAAQGQARLTGTQLIVQETVTRSWRQLNEAEARHLAATQAIDAAALSVRGLQIEYEAGRRTLIDVLDGQRDLVTANISKSEAEHDYRTRLYELAAAAGRLSSEAALVE